MVDSCLRQILMDRQTLDDYENNRTVTWSDIERRLLVNERTIDPHIPDHLYRGACGGTLGDKKINSLSKFLTDGLAELANIYITEENDDKIYIERGKFSAWQDLTTLCPPLPLFAAYLHSKNNLINNDYITYLNSLITPNVRYTALFAPRIKELQELRHSNHGFNDLHIHLNGSTETDSLWQDALNDPRKFARSYRALSLKDSKLLEQIEQENVFRDADRLYNLLERARALRQYLILSLFTNKFLVYPNTTLVMDAYNSDIVRGQHPLKKMLGSRFYDDDCDTKLPYSEIEYECLMYVMILNQLQNKPIMAKAFHHYLLILGCLNRFVVHQIHQNGFQQFQKIADNDLRKSSEGDYTKRFFQLCGNDLSQSNFKIFEGRFAPKATPKDINKLIDRVELGWTSFKDKYAGTVNGDETKLYLIPHFIKRRESSSDMIYHEKIRSKLFEQTRAVLSLWKDSLWMPNHESHRDDSPKPILNLKKLVGIDAAASEFDAPPEVFASSYRKIRHELRESENKCRFTFHAGEDFSHIVSGLRAIFETIIFLDLEENDRIGHGTALGLSYKRWQSMMDQDIWMKRGEFLDDLVFCYYILDHYKSGLSKLCDCRYEKEIANLVIKIKYNFNRIYDASNFNDPSIHNIVTAWLNRMWNPYLFFQTSYSDASQQPNFDPTEWSNFEAARLPEEVKDIMRAYLTNRQEYNTCMLVKKSKFSNKLVTEIQEIITEIIKQKEIVIETLPTSNVRISVYKNYAEHHLRSWLKQDLKVVVGTDDAGIFATNIYNEYAHICNMGIDIPHVKKLIENSNDYVFGGEWP